MLAVTISASNRANRSCNCRITLSDSVLLLISVLLVLPVLLVSVELTADDVSDPDCGVLIVIALGVFDVAFLVRLAAGDRLGELTDITAGDETDF